MLCLRWIHYSTFNSYLWNSSVLLQLWVHYRCKYKSTCSAPRDLGTIPCIRWVELCTQSAGPVRFFIFCSRSIFLLASLVAGRGPSVLLGRRSREYTCTPLYLSTGISQLQPAQAEVVLGHLSTYLASWVVYMKLYTMGELADFPGYSILFFNATIVYSL